MLCLKLLEEQCLFNRQRTQNCSTPKRPFECARINQRNLHETISMGITSLHQNTPITDSNILKKTVQLSQNSLFKSFELWVSYNSPVVWRLELKRKFNCTFVYIEKKEDFFHLILWFLSASFLPNRKNYSQISSEIK